MTVFIITFVFCVLIIVAMSVGVMMGREPISGSCGGSRKLIEMGLTDKCEICGWDPTADDEQNVSDDMQALAYDASQPK